ncbi:NADP-dependent 3-hydroxy acid dehydrogenase YdfG [Actinomadura hallensis]|uniref:NADP-dependent 3-hydroxy acid dehydrogenase YdfG n=1 Tax=Actinomadura hallensis TaxID=337895 RepID=A0A543ILL3_9ACTN|nr:SDR family NAD(P)-dependent oxidoreductase [Actinomadura hallensis]TQM71428.1 NADP-dependent 3-hydroxy acid dehydrogenase YdfG [Actinomadura hallensis]HLV75194.1 SDR family NAD(P)-dependent oxidoreductase [Vulgatibacteraceae bacterium]
MTRTALVTGAAGGLGALAARRLAAAAWDVVAVDADAEGLARTALRSPNMHVRTCDVTDPGAVADVVAMAGSVQRVVHASAVPPAGPTLEQPPDEVERALRTGVLGAVNVVRATLPGMLERGSGELILCPAHPEPDVPDGPAPASMTTASMTTASMATGSMITAAVAAYADALFAEHGGRGVTIRCCAAPPGVAPRLVLDAVDRSLARPAAEVRVTPAPGLRRLLPARAARGAAAGGFAPR